MNKCLSYLCDPTGFLEQYCHSLKNLNFVKKPFFLKYYNKSSGKNVNTALWEQKLNLYQARSVLHYTLHILLRIQSEVYCVSVYLLTYAIITYVSHQYEEGLVSA
jgi:hypothetical protein